MAVEDVIKGPLDVSLANWFSKIQFGVTTSAIATVIQSIIFGGVILWGAYYFGYYRRLWDIDIIILAKRGDQSVAAVGYDKGRSILKYNEKKFKLKKRKRAKVEIPNYDFIRMSEKGRKVLFVWKFGEDDYVAADPSIITEKTIETTEINKETGEKVIKQVQVKELKFKPTEAASDQLMILDIREILSLYDKKTGIDKYGYLVAIIIIGIIFVLSLWIFSKNMVTAAQIIAGAQEKVAEKCATLATIGQSISQS